MNPGKEKNEAISSRNISYYNHIAAQYDAIQNDDKKNVLIRNRVAEYFISQVQNGRVLDFGGGTGLDLNWLVKQRYHILFCEPSVAMRQKATERCRTEYLDTSIVFVEGEQTDFRKWSAGFPFVQEINAVLANFAVVNCIPDISNLFEKLAFVLSPGGSLVTLMLDAGLFRKFRTNFKATIEYLFTGKPVGFHTDFNGEQQCVNLYSSFEIKTAAREHFDMVHYERLPGFGFCLIHLVKK